MQQSDSNLLAIKPKKLEEVYRQTGYLLQFDPKTKRVIWQFAWTVMGSTVHFYDTSATFDRARRACRKKIDELLDGKK